MSSPYSLQPVGETNIDPRLTQGTIREVFLSPPSSFLSDNGWIRWWYWCCVGHGGTMESLTAEISRARLNVFFKFPLCGGVLPGLQSGSAAATTAHCCDDMVKDRKQLKDYVIRSPYNRLVLFMAYRDTQWTIETCDTPQEIRTCGLYEKKSFSTQSLV